MKRLFFLLAAALAFSSCSPVYVIKSAAGHGGLLWRRESIDRILHDPRAPEALKEKLRLVVEIRKFAFDEMGLAPSKDYNAIAKVEGPHVTTIVTACEKTRFAPYLWWFPFVGRVPYKGYFKAAAAWREKKALEKKGYDAFLSGVAAYNTPLWFADPIPSPLLDDPPGELASVLIHELTHGTVFFKNEVGFDEALATFVGDQGAEDFLSRRFGPGSSELREFRAGLARQRDFTRMINGIYARLEALYHGGAPDAEKLRLREGIFEEARARLRERDGGASTPTVNNAMILAYRLYYDDAGDFKAAYERNGRDWPRAIRFFQTLDRRRPREDLRGKVARP